MKIWEIIKHIEAGEEDISSLGEIRGTMVVNYGKRGRCRKNVIDESSTTIEMIVDVFTFYEEQITDLQELVPK